METAIEVSQVPLPPIAQSIVESAPDAIVIVDRTGRILLVNDQTERLFGYDRSELVGRSIEMLVPAKARESHVKARARYDAERSRRLMHARDIELFAVRKDGSIFPVEIGLSPVESEGHAFTIAAVRDISMRKQAEEERIRLARAEEGIRVRDEFLSVAAHELRTPLTALQLQLQSLQKGLAIADFNRDLMQAKVWKAVRQLARMSQLVDQLLDVTRIAFGPLTLQPEKVDIVSLVRGVVEDFQDQAARAGCTITVTARASAEGTWDRFRIEQVLVNLLSNAIKYGAGQPVAIEVDANDLAVRVRVRDQGIGISPPEVDRIFERFARGSGAERFGGLGLGLYIAKQMTESHGGQLRVSSEAGKGATFELELPRSWPERLER